MSNNHRGRGGRFQRRAPSAPAESQQQPVAPESSSGGNNTAKANTTTSSQNSRHFNRKQRSENFRVATNEKVINEFATKNTLALKSNLFSEFSSLSDALKTAHVEPQTQAIRFSFSVRGIGLTLFECTERVRLQMPDIDIPLHSFYRVALLHLAAKYDVVRLKGEIEFDEPFGGESTTLLDSDTRSIVQMNPLNFSPVSGLINCCGRFKIDDVSYFPSLVREITPLSFSIRTLRELVMRLADPNTPVDVRMRYVNLNSIPGLMFENEMNPIAVNPDEIMPAEYNPDAVRADFLRVKACLARIGRKLPKLVGSVNFDDRGNAGQLLSTEVYGGSPRIRSFAEYRPNVGMYVPAEEPCIVGDVRDWFTARKLTQEQVVSGAITLNGEFCIQRPAEVLTPWVANRSARCAIARYAFSRENIILGMLG